MEKLKNYKPTKFMLDTSHYDKAKADYAVNFIECLSHTKGSFAGVKFDLIPWQEQIIRDVFGTIKQNGYRQFNTAYVEIPKKCGKALLTTTKIPTPTGWSTMGDLRVGDLVYDEKGQPCHVVAKSPVDMESMAYKITWRDDSFIIADARHQWEVDYIYGKTQHKIMTSEEIYNLHKRLHDKYGDTPDGLRSYIRISVTKPLQRPDINLPVDPYLYGFWIGDGTSDKPYLSICNDDLEAVAKNIPYEIKTSYPNVGNSTCVRYDVLKNILVTNHREKCIRQEYLLASERQRWELLAGLIDSDGHISSIKGQTIYSTSNPKIRDGVQELLSSLGIKNNCTESPSSYHGRLTGETIYTIRFVSYDDMPVSKLDRYLCRRRKRTADTRNSYHYIKSIEPLGNGIPMQCIQVDSPSHCYLAGRSMIPTHNSELAAAVALLLLCGDGEERAEIYGCAADRHQATIVFEVAADMIRLCPALQKRVKILESTKRIEYLPTKSFYQVLSAEAFSKHGFNVHGVIFDELHTQPNRKLYDVMTKGSGDARTQPLYFLITTAGDNTNSICYEVHQKAEDILNGRKHDPTFYPVIYGAAPEDDWTDPEVWKKANPSLGITIQMEKVEAACNSAKENPAEENAFRQLRLNQWVKQSVRWMPMDKWDACDYAVNAEALRGRRCYGGLDLSSTTDLTAFVLIFPPEDEYDKYYIMPFFWLPEDQIDLRVKRDHVLYDLWARQGHIQTTEGNVVHYGFIQKFIEKLGEKYNIAQIAYDPWNATQLTQNLEDEGFTMVAFPQTMKNLATPTKELYKLVFEQKIAHGGHPVLRWNMDNIYIKQDANENIRPDKEHSTEKIDGAVACIMALDRAMRCMNVQSGSVYDNRGLITF